MRRIITLLTAVLLMFGLMAAPALAWHQHTLHTPGTEVTFRCEPEAAAGVHPIHNGLHLGLRDRGRSLDASTDPVYVRAVGTPSEPVCEY